MKDGFVKVAAATPKIKVADCEYNKKLIIDIIGEANNNNVKILVLPELCITGYTCSDLFLQDTLLSSAKEALVDIAKSTANFDIMVVVGVPLRVECKLYNCAAFIKNGKVVAIVPKINLPNYQEFYEARHFTKGNEKVKIIEFNGDMVPFGSNILLKCNQIDELIIGCEICEDLWVPYPPSTRHAMNGATVICNPSASVETTVKDAYRRNLVGGQAARLVCGYIYADAGEGESTTDVVYSAHNIIAENGTVLAEAKRFINETVTTELDLKKIAVDRQRMTTFDVDMDGQYFSLYFDFNVDDTNLTRKYSRTPFIPSNMDERNKRCNEILTIQAMGLKKRIEHTNCKSAVIGLSGGLDSTLALLVTVRAFDMLNIERKNILCITMPGYGTTDRTYQNAIELSKKLDTSLKEVSIVPAVEQHFKDIEQDKDVHDITYENSQARERTQILMDFANKTNGMVIGTGDMSELALGWATYNGDHMSMYAVNASVPKTLVRHLVKYFADTCENIELSNILLDVLDTPVSPELLPPEQGKISQKTEDIVGPYELHDFYLYFILRLGMSPKKIYRIAKYTFEGKYDNETILKWLKTFYRRFFAQQFKRSCIPDGPKVGSVAVSPRGDLRMPSDACANIWLNELNNLK